MSYQSSTLGFSVLVALLAAAGCSANDADVHRNMNAGFGGSGGTAMQSGGLGGEAAGVSGWMASGGSPGTGGSTVGTGATGMGGGVQLQIDGGGSAAETTCDGIDNDNNGIIDDVDIGGDGVCDCLNIATIGWRGAYTSDIFAGWLGSRSPTGSVALGDQILNDDLLRPYQVIVVLNVETRNTKGVSYSTHAFSADESATLARWVQAGGGLMTTTGFYDGDSGAVLRINALLQAVGVAYENVLWPVSGYITRWAAHPVTAGISKIYTLNGARPDEAFGLTPLGWDAQGDLALGVKSTGAGRIAMWADDWIIFDSQWQAVTDQQVELFWLNLLKWLSPPNQCQVPIPNVY